MKLNSIVVAAAILLATELSAQGLSSAEPVMQKVADKLAAVKVLGYKYRFEYRYPSQERSTEVTAQAFLELKPTDGTSQFRFQFTTGDSFDAYNGAERFMLDKKSKKLYVQNKPSFKSFGNIFLQNSPLSLKYALPKIIGDVSIQKKVSLIKTGDREAYIIEFSLPKGIINSAGEILEIRPDQTNKYQLKIDKATLFPLEVTQANDKNDEILKTTYAEVTENPAIPSESSWYFSTYQGEYKLEKKDELTLIEIGKEPANFSLTLFPSDNRVSLDKYQGKLVLIEFWIAHCGFCIAAVPKLNQIAERFRDMGLELISINMYDPATTIEYFKKKNKPEFTILTGGDSVATLYGVDSYPAFVLIGKSGKVVYSSSGLQEKEMEAAIIANLKE